MRMMGACRRSRGHAEAADPPWSTSPARRAWRCERSAGSSTTTRPSAPNSSNGSAPPSPNLDYRPDERARHLRLGVTGHPGRGRPPALPREPGPARGGTRRPQGRPHGPGRLDRGRREDRAPRGRVDVPPPLRRHTARTHRRRPRLPGPPNWRRACRWSRSTAPSWAWTSTASCPTTWPASRRPSPTWSPTATGASPTSATTSASTPRRNAPRRSARASRPSGGAADHMIHTGPILPERIQAALRERPVGPRRRNGDHHRERDTERRGRPPLPRQIGRRGHRRLRRLGTRHLAPPRPDRWWHRTTPRSATRPSRCSATASPTRPPRSEGHRSR